MTPCARNVKNNNLEGAVQCRPLDWAVVAHPGANFRATLPSFDYIVAADTLYYQETYPLLAAVMQKLASAHTTIFLAFPVRSGKVGLVGFDAYQERGFLMPPLPLLHRSCNFSTTSVASFNGSGSSQSTPPTARRSTWASACARSIAFKWQQISSCTRFSHAHRATVTGTAVQELTTLRTRLLPLPPLLRLHRRRDSRLGAASAVSPPVPSGGRASQGSDGGIAP